MKEIPLTQGYVALVDDEDYERLSQFKWHAFKAKHTTYASRTELVPKQHEVRMHREVLRVQTGSGTDVDHKDNNGLNNQKLNLRETSHQKNCWNSKPYQGKTTRGVTFLKRLIRRPWQAKIFINGKHTHLGYFPTEVDAGRAYDAAASEHRGEFAKLNSEASQ